MPRAALADVTSDSLLTSISVSYTQDAKGFIASRVFPVVTVDEATGKFYEFERADILRSDATVRTPGTRAALKTFGVNKKSYSCEQYALGYDLPDELRRTRNSPLANDRAAVSIVAGDLLIKRDKLFIAAFMANSVWGNTDKVGTTDFTKWDQPSATILQNVFGWSDDIKKACGRRPNVAVVTPDVWKIIKDDADIVDRVKYVSKDPVSEDLVARLMGIDELLVLDSVEATSVEGAATVTTAFTATQKFLLCYRENSPDILTPSAGYIFSWPEFDEVREAAENGAPAMQQWRKQDEKSDHYEGTMYHDPKIVTPTAGLLARSVVA